MKKQSDIEKQLDEIIGDKPRGHFVDYGHILYCVVTRALQGGWRRVGGKPFQHIMVSEDPQGPFMQILDCEGQPESSLEIFDVLFDHDFAKAIFGILPTPSMFRSPDGYGMQVGPAWRTHLQLMAVETDPMLYLARYLGIPA